MYQAALKENIISFHGKKTLLFEKKFGSFRAYQHDRINFGGCIFAFMLQGWARKSGSDWNLNWCPGVNVQRGVL